MECTSLLKKQTKGWTLIQALCDLTSTATQEHRELNVDYMKRPHLSNKGSKDSENTERREVTQLRVEVAEGGVTESLWIGMSVSLPQRMFHLLFSPSPGAEKEQNCKMEPEGVHFEIRKTIC